MKWSKYTMIAVGYAALITTGSSIPGGIILPVTILTWDKLLHLVEYSGFGIVLGLAFKFSISKTRSNRWYFYAPVIGISYAIFDELYQSLIPGRVSSVYDVIADAGGVFLAMMVLPGIFRFIDERKSAETEVAE